MGSLFKGATENMAAILGVERMSRTGTAPALVDRTSLYNNNNNNHSGTSSKQGKPIGFASQAQVSARPPLPESARHSNVRDVSTRTSEAWAGDDADSSNAQACAEYIQDIFTILREEETRGMPSPDYMDSLPDINARMRGVLVDWLVEVHLKYKLRPETLFLAVLILDRFLARKCVSRKKLQLVGVVATLIAAKYEEIFPPKISDLVYICDRAYTRNEILEMELVVLTTLEFKLRVPTAVQFLDRFAKVNGSSEQTRHLAQYLAELALPEIKMIKHTPSHLAAAATFLSNKLFEEPSVWSQTMRNQTGYTEAAIVQCVGELYTILERAQGNSLQAVRKKFSYAKYNSVARIPF
jgi:cyclin B